MSDDDPWWVKIIKIIGRWTPHGFEIFIGISIGVIFKDKILVLVGKLTGQKELGA